MLPRRAAVLAAALLLPSAIPLSATVPEDSWGVLAPLVGEWKGTGSGFGSVSQLTHTWRFVLDDRFLELRTHSVSETEDGNAEVHEDIGFISRDTDAATFVFRQFLSEGYVNTFDVGVAGEPLVLDFAPRESESAGGMRARMRLTFVNHDEYTMVLELAAPGKDFAACQRMHLTRVE